MKNVANIEIVGVAHITLTVNHRWHGMIFTTKSHEAFTKFIFTYEYLCAFFILLAFPLLSSSHFLSLHISLSPLLSAALLGHRQKPEQERTTVKLFQIFLLPTRRSWKNMVIVDMPFGGLFRCDFLYVCHSVFCLVKIFEFNKIKL